MYKKFIEQIIRHNLCSNVGRIHVATVFARNKQAMMIPPEVKSFKTLHIHDKICDAF